MAIEFYDRTQQVIEHQEKALEVRGSITKEEAIKELEDILAFEFVECQEISKGIVDFEENLDILRDYMENALKKIDVGENIVIYTEEFNEEIVAIKDKLLELQKRYSEEWASTDDVENRLKEFIELSLLEYNELITLVELIAAKQTSIQKRNFEDYTDLQTSRMKGLEAMVYGEL